jgi:hypothetical protein
MRRVCVALLVALAACGDNGSEPDDPVFDGTWTGVYTNNASTVAFQAELQLNQNGDQITGGLATSSGRSATVSGTVSGDQLEATFTYTDGCAGTATVTADLVDERVPPELTGTYVSTDCVGETTGTFALTKQE